MNEIFVKQETFKIVEAVLKIDLGNRCKRSEIPEWDSLKHIDIVFAVEDRFKIQFSPDEMVSIGSIDRAIELVLQKVEKN